MHMNEPETLEIIDSNSTKWFAKFSSSHSLRQFVENVSWDRNVGSKNTSKRIMESDDEGNYFNPSHIFRMRRIYSEED